MKNVVSLLACWVAVFVSVPAGQQLPPVEPLTFRTGVDAVQLDVSVLDEQRRPVRGLTAADFTVLEDGKPRRLVAFSAVELPPVPAAAISRRGRAARRHPHRTSRPTRACRGPNDLPQGRLVVIIVDPFLEREEWGNCQCGVCRSTNGKTTRRDVRFTVK